MCTYRGQCALARLISLTSFLSICPFTLSVPRSCQAQCCLRASVFIPSSREAPAADSLTADSSLSLSRCSVLLGEASLDLRESGSFTSLQHSVTSPVACSFSHYYGLTLSYTHIVYTPQKNISSVRARTCLLDSLLYTLRLVRSSCLGSIFNFYFILKHIHLTMLWWFQVDSKRTQPYIYMYIYIYVSI